MPSLLELAPELLATILDFVAGDMPVGWRTTDLSSLALTCRTLHQLSNPLLYRLFCHNEYYGNPNRLSKFLRTISNRPTLAAKVSDLILAPYEDEEDEDINSGIENSDDESEDANSVPEDNNIEIEEAGDSNDSERRQDESSLNDIFIKALEAMPWYRAWLANHTPNTQAWVDAIKQKDNTNVLCGILLLSVPNLQRLTVVIEYHLDQPWFLASIEEAVYYDATSSTPRFLTNLKEVQFVSDSFHYNVRQAHVDDFLYIPSLKKLNVSQLFADFSSHEHLPPKVSSIESLLLSDSSKIDGWKFLLGPMKNLKQLEFSPRWSEMEEDSANQVSEIAESLILVKETLESLKLLSFKFANVATENSLLGSLRDFSKLRDLRIQLGLLIGVKGMHVHSKQLWELLPSSLEQLMLVSENENYNYPAQVNRTDWLDHVAGVIRRRNMHFPCLQKLSISAYGNNVERALESVRVEDNCRYSRHGHTLQIQFRDTKETQLDQESHDTS